MKPFSLRKLVSLLSLYSFLIMTVSGIVLYFVPPTRVANFIKWTFWGLDKHEHARFHVVFSIVFVIASLFHTYYNWNSIRLYLKEKWKTGLFLRSESLVAIVITALFVFVTFYDIFPAKQIMDWSESLKSSWETKAGVGTIPRGGGSGK